MKFTPQRMSAESPKWLFQQMLAKNSQRLEISMMVLLGFPSILFSEGARGARRMTDKSPDAGHGKLIDAVISRDMDALADAVSREDLNEADHDGWTALHIAARVSW